MGWFGRVDKGTARKWRATTMVAAAALSSGGALVGMAGTASAAPFANGSFETPAITGIFEPRSVGGTIGAWTVVAGTVDIVRDGWVAADGAQSVDLNGSTPGRICQTFDTVAGRTYDLAFAMSRNYFSTSADATVTIGTQNSSFTHDAAGPSPEDMLWEPHTVPFTATAVATSICFGGDVDNGSTGPAIDDVTVTERNGAPTATIVSPADGAVYFEGQQILADYTCTDAEGPVSCIGDIPAGNSLPPATVGTHDFTVVATDSDGLTDEATSTYQVVSVTSLCKGTAASVLGINLGQANPPTTPCANDTETLIGQNQFIGNPLPWPFSQFNPVLRLGVVSSTTESTPGKAVAESSIASAAINLPFLGLNIALAGIHSSARSQLLGGCGPATVHSLSRVGTLIINGAPILVADSPVSIPLIVGTLHLNQQVRVGNNIVRRAVSLDLPGTALDVVLGETIVGVHCNAPTPAP